MKKENDLTTGNICKTLVWFALPYLIAAFMQTFYGMVDLFVIGVYNGSTTTTAVSIGSQVMHMLTVIILGFAMGTTVNIGKCIGAKDQDGVSRTIGSSAIFFIGFSIILTTILLLLTENIVHIMSTPAEAVTETVEYLRICFIGVPMVVAYNVISSIYRGRGDSKSPMLFVFVAAVVNIILDYVFIGVMGKGAMGAALGTVAGQTVSVVVALIAMLRRREQDSHNITKSFDADTLKSVLSVGAPIALQDGLIQVSFIIITIIANNRGLVAAASVGIVEKLIGFMFLVPSAFSSAISAVTAQNIGAGLLDRAKKSLYYALAITMGWGIICTLYNQFLPHTLVGLFSRDSEVVAAGCEYIRSYSADTFFAAIHFCYSGYFCGKQKSIISFIHNIIAIVTVRIPGAYFTSMWFATTLYPMGAAAPIGSLLSAVICICAERYMMAKNK